MLLIADEIQSGLGRTGRTLACEHEGVVADVYLLGKALGGGIVPVSAVVADRDGARRAAPRHPRQHVRRQPAGLRGRSGGGDLLATGEYQQRATELGMIMRARLDAMIGHGVRGVRSRGLWAGIDIEPELGTGRDLCEALARARRAGQGHPWRHPPAGPADRDHRGAARIMASTSSRERSTT